MVGTPQQLKPITAGPYIIHVNTLMLICSPCVAGIVAIQFYKTYICGICLTPFKASNCSIQMEPNHLL